MAADENISVTTRPPDIFMGTPTSHKTPFDTTNPDTGRPLNIQDEKTYATIEPYIPSKPPVRQRRSKPCSTSSSRNKSIATSIFSPSSYTKYFMVKPDGRNDLETYEYYHHLLGDVTLSKNRDLSYTLEVQNEDASIFMKSLITENPDSCNVKIHPQHNYLEGTVVIPTNLDFGQIPFVDSRIILYNHIS